MNIDECKRIIKRLSNEYGCSFDYKNRIVLEKVYDSYVEFLSIPQEIQVLADNSLSHLTNLKKIIFPKGLIFIGKNVFSDCKKLQEIIFPAVDLKKYYGTIIPEDKICSYIPESSFANCSSLKRVILPTSCSFIGPRAFWNCSSLNNIIIPKSTTQICRSAFQGCTSLKKITIPDSVTEIQEYAFADTGIRFVELPENLKKIGLNAFPENCETKRVKKSDGSDTYKKEDSFIQKNKQNSHVMKNDKNCKTDSSLAKDTSVFEGNKGLSIEDFIYQRTNDGICVIGIKNSVISSFPIYMDVNSKDRALTYTILQLPEGITEIAESAFSPTPILDLLPISKEEMKRSKFLNRIVELRLPNGLKKIGRSSFNFCKNISTITIPESVEEIGALAFNNTALECVILPAKLTKIGANAFPKECKLLRLKQ